MRVIGGKPQTFGREATALLIVGFLGLMVLVYRSPQNKNGQFCTVHPCSTSAIRALPVECPPCLREGQALIP